jgi:hypothetical protein
MFGSLLRSSIPDDALEYAGFVLAHCAAIADSNRSGELICPFAVLTGNTGRQVVDFESESQAEAVEKGWESLSDAKSKKLWWAFGREGISRAADGTGRDVITVTVWLPRMTSHISVQQLFERGPEQEFRLVGDTELLIHGTDVASPVEKWDRAIVARGISSHPQGGRWGEWRSH